jgi:hypothetical protein
LTPAEERVLACVREGMPNADIAVRLGVSVNTVRYHVSNLLAKAGAASREELGRWRPRAGEGGGHSRAWAGLLLAKPVALVLALVAVASVGMFFFAPLPKEDVEPVELPEPFTRPDADELRAQGFVDTGEFLRSEGEGHLVLGHSPRKLFSVLKLRPGEFLVGESGRITPRPFNPWNYWFTVSLVHDDFRYFVDVRIRAGQSIVMEPRPASAESGVAVRFSAFASSDVLVSAYVSERGELGRTWVGDTIRVSLTPDGHLWIDPEPLAAGGVYDDVTGAELKVEDSELVGSFPNDGTLSMRNICDELLVAADPEVSTPADACAVQHLPAGAGLFAPFEGTLICETTETLRLEGAAVTARFTRANIGVGGDPNFDCEQHDVTAGERIGPTAYYIITGHGRGGEITSLAISQDGHLYAGDFAPDIGCPCRQGN